jgi:hypothetical protein
MLYAGRHQRSLILLLLFAGWTVSPFLAAAFACVISKRRPGAARAALSIVTLILTLGSLVVYAATAFGYTSAKVGFVFLVGPFLSWVLLAIVAAIALRAPTSSRSC